MSPQDLPGQDPPDVSRRQERAIRILDAAGTLFLRYGYNRTTLEDIARQASVAKSTLYQHWNTREDLFMALMIREKALLTDDFRCSIAADPAGPTLGGILKHSALALMKRPLLKAVFLRDMDVVGKLLQREQVMKAAAERVISFQTYLEFLRTHGLVRNNLNLQEQVYMVSAIFVGFFITAPMMPENLGLSEEANAELMAETVRRTLESDHAKTPDEAQAISAAFLQYVNRSTAIVAEQYQQALQSNPPQKEEHSK